MNIIYWFRKNCFYDLIITEVFIPFFSKCAQGATSTMPIKDNWGREVVDVILLDLFISLMLSDIYRLWPAKLHIRSPINIFVAQGTVE